MENRKKVIKLNLRGKGARNELRAKKELESDGWKVFRVQASVKWQKQEDVWGLFDLIAIKRGKLRFVQVKSNQKSSMKPFNEFWIENNAPNISVEVWIWKDYKGWHKVFL